MKKLVILIDPSASGFNLGDTIITSAVRQELCSLLNSEEVWPVALHQRLSSLHRRRLKLCDAAIVAGSNMLSLARWPMLREPRWPVSLQDVPVLKARVVLAGVGWSNPSQRTNMLGRWFYKKVLNPAVVHAVRDSYTATRMNELGYANVLNTSCPTLWGLADEHCKQIPQGKAREVVTTLTDYSPDRTLDRELLENLKRSYRRVWFWPQGSLDARYLKELGFDDISPIDASIAAFDKLLTTSDSLDYVGTRLHGGIRALQKGRRTLIVNVDHRASTIATDTGLRVCERSAVTSLSEMVEESWPTELRLPWDAIVRWRRGVQGALA